MLTGSACMPRPSLQLTQNHERIIRYINRYHYLTAEQFLTLLGYSDGTIKTLKGYLKELTDNKYLHSFYLPATSKSRPFVYGLGMRGRKYLIKTNEWNGVYSLPSEEKTYYTLMHILELNDFLIALEALTRLTPSLHLFDMQHDLTLKRRPFLVTDLSGKKYGLIPDALVDVRLERQGRRPRRYFFWIELDRETISNDAFREKIRNILLFTKNGLQEQYFGIEQPIPFLFATTAGARRVEKMLTLARMEFAAHPTASRNLMLKFAAVPPLMWDYPDPSQIFCRPYWQSPYSDPSDLATLIDLST